MLIRMPNPAFFKIFVIYLCLFTHLSVGLISKRKKIVQHGDLMIGSLLPVHQQPSAHNDNTLKVTFIQSTIKLFCLFNNLKKNILFAYFY